MADRLEPYHVPQQSRRDKLRVSQQGCDSNHLGCDALGLLPLYDSSLISDDFMNCTDLHCQSFNLGSQTDAGVKETGMNLMGFVGGVNMITAAASSSSLSSSHLFADPQLSVQLTPSTVQDINGSTYEFNTPNSYGVILDQSFQGNEVVTSGQSLSLSLSSHYNNLPLELNLRRYDSTLFNSGNKVRNGGYFLGGNGNSSTQLTRNSVPLGPFTGYASVLKGSRFLKPAHQLLEELCVAGRGFFADKVTTESSLLDPTPESFNGHVADDESLVYCSDGGEHSGKKSWLLSLLDEVYKRYKQYYHQIQAVFTSFESVAGLSSAAPFVNLAVKAMSKHFSNLKNAITDELHLVSKSHGKMKYEMNRERRLETYGKGILGQPVWRPQRGLPERAVTVLRAWLFDHFLHPYPTDTDKLMLAKQTGLTRNQVSNWFINARVRLWKPMVEEIHMLETQKVLEGESNCCMENERHEDISLKGSRNIAPINRLSSHKGCRGGVSLTLGLHQGLPESYPVTAARRFGLDAQILHEFQEN